MPRQDKVTLSEKIIRRTVPVIRLGNAANSVKRYSAALNGSSLIKNGYYAANTLYGEKTTDEDGKSLTVFTDKRGRKVLERRGTNNDTYYVYDDLDQQRFVLSPQYQESGYKDTYGYEYRYDEKGRLAKKILPQCGFTQYWYDTAGRMKFMQDSTLRAKRPALYRFYLYDKYGRLCIQGTCTGCLRGEAVNTATYIGSNGGFHSTGYSVSRTGDISSPTGVTIEQVNYYDGYDFVDALYSGNSLGQASSVSTKGLLTGMRQTASDGTMLLNANYYDYKGRVTDVRSTTLANRRMRTSNTYNYWGGITQTQQYVYSPNGTQELYVTGSNTYYNNTNLLYSSTRGLRIGTGSAHSATIHELTYDDLGRVNTDKRGKSTYNTLTYRYNVHGWLDSLGTTAFQERLYYADAPYGATPCYNGNISVQKWKQSNEGFNRGYKFTYDALNRLTEAVYGENDFSDNLNDYNEKVVEYSLNGMMKRFQRRGKKSDGEYGKVDNLHIHLDGNRPVEISDDAALQTVYGAMEFRDGSTSGTEYYYDGNGSLVADANKGIAMIEYDNLNYPRRIQFTNGNTIEYVYSPDGQKLRAKWQTAAGNVVVPLNTTLSITASSTTQTDYVGDLIYTGTDATADNPELSKILYPDGYFMRTSGTSGVFRYFVKDHLGNNRVVNNGTAVYQRTHYYPFGGPYADVGTASDYQPYKYNGKELDRMHGLDLYDYGARQYDPIVPMFTQQDPLAEKYYHLSPYAYCGSNPVKYVDLEGLELGDYYNLSGTRIGSNGLDDNQKYIVIDKKEVKIIKQNAKMGKSTPLQDTHSTISLPSSEVISQANNAINSSDITNSEFGFVVSTDGATSTMYSGDRSSVQTGRGFSELQDMGKETAFDVHTHPLDYSSDGNGNYTIGDYRPSPHDIKMREIREKNISVTQPSWIIGYNPSNIGIPSINTATRVVTFYTSKGVVGTVNWNSFNKVINKLR